MSSKQVVIYGETTASKQGGCLSAYLLPPLTVLALGFAMAFIWMSAEPTGSINSQITGFTGQSQIQSSTGETSPIQDANLQFSGSISPVFSPEVQYWRNSIGNWSSAAGLDPNLVATVMQIESCGDPAARSSAGAIGLFQVMPYHFSSGEDPYNPDTNALRGLAYLKRSLQAANGDARFALAGYNGGIAVINLSELKWPGETQRYTYWGNGIYTEASNGDSTSRRLQEWMDSYGASLCRQASSQLGITQ